MSTRDDLNLVVTDLHGRITGVSATVRTLVPHIASQEPLALVSHHPHSDVKPMGLWRALKMCLRRPRDKPFRLWHARRSNEMVWGLIFKYIFRCPIRLIVTSCALRRHSWYPRSLMASMDAVIATSDDAARYVTKVVATIPHGVDCHRFQPAADRARAYRRWGLPGRYGISICGRVRPEKGTDLFVNAMIELLPDFPDFTACIAGKATKRFIGFQQELSRKIEAAGLSDRILWMGEIDYEKMPEFHAAMSLCVAPARYEGFGLVPLEAMACEVPVVASRTGCYPDVIVPSLNGDLVDCADQQGLVDALRKIMSDEGRLIDMGTVGRKRVRELFSAEAEAQQIVQVYRDMWSKAA